MGRCVGTCIHVDLWPRISGRRTRLCVRTDVVNEVMKQFLWYLMIFFFLCLCVSGNAGGGSAWA